MGNTFCAVAASSSLHGRKSGEFEKRIVNLSVVTYLNVNTGQLSLISGDTMWLGDDSLRMVESKLMGKERDETGYFEDQDVRDGRGQDLRADQQESGRA